MIKGITFVRAASTTTVYDALTSFFDTLGFEPGRGWENESSRSRPYLAPLANLEFVSGIAPLAADTLIEVTQLDEVHGIAKAWIEQRYGIGEGDSAERITRILPTDWKSRAFTIEPVPGNIFAFWEWEDSLKGKPVAIEGDLSATGMRFAIVVARWNAVITDRLLQGSLDGILRSGGRRADIEIVRVPGAWEIPDAARKLADTKRYDAIITLGCLLRGETAHYEAIYNEVARGIGQSQQESGIPHSFGVLTCETLEQALDRAGVKAGNKGFEAAIAAIEMISIHHKIEAGSEAAR